MKRGTFGILWILLALGPSWAQTQEEGVEGADDAFVETALAVFDRWVAEGKVARA